MFKPLRSISFDTFFILTVGIWATLLSFALQHLFAVASYSGVYWILLVVGCDVAHVYSTLFRTYLSEPARSEYRSYLIYVPIVVFACGFVAALLSVKLFWMVLAYIAIFHFIRQQIGLIRIYRHKRGTLEEWAIYVVTIGSVVYWHLSSVKVFNWFTKDDFISTSFINEDLKIKIQSILNILLVSVMFGYGGFLVFKAFRKNLNLPIAFITLSTFASWYLGIVVSGSDFVFSMTNVLSHGVPYLALVWHTQKKEKTVYSSLQIFFFIIIAAAFFEEALWDAFVWREHAEYFESFYFLKQLESNWAVALGLAFLIVPQLTHYILDGVIWKKNGQKRSWSV